MCVETLRIGLVFLNDQFEGYIPRFTLKMNVFPPISLETP